MSAEGDARTRAYVPCLTKRGDSLHVSRAEGGPTLGIVSTGPNTYPWGWTVGLGWHTGLPTLGAALDALLADPAFGVDVHATSDSSDYSGGES